MQLIGCSMDHFMDWLQYNFDEHMSFDNYGLYWDIDHVLPCSSFDLSISSDIEKCFHWSNLAPLEHIKNIKKSNKIDMDLVTHYKNRAAMFELKQQLGQMDLSASGASSTKSEGKPFDGSDKQTEVW